jgi:aspartate/methionine/tyrosine aminotransferase
MFLTYQGCQRVQVGQPSTGAPAKVKDAAVEALQNDKLAYTGSLGIPAVRKRLAEMYTKNGDEVRERYEIGVRVDRRHA